MALGGDWPPPLFLLSNNLFLGSIIAMLMWTLLRHHAQDSYRDNGFFLLVLPAFLVAKTLLLHGEHFAAGHGMALALFRMAFLVMMERTLTQFMRGNFQVDILRRPLLDNAIKLLGLLLVIEFVLAPGLAAAAALLLALLLAARFLFWKPHAGAAAHRHRHHVHRLPADRGTARGAGTGATRGAGHGPGRSRCTCSVSA